MTKKFINRELSWLSFNERVLQEAEDQATPLFERIRFIGIFSNNLDEFFMVRVAGLKRRIAAGVAVPSASGILPRDLHELMLSRAHDLVVEQARIFAEDIRPALALHGIRPCGSGFMPTSALDTA